MDEVQRQRVTADVEGAMRSFEAAERQLDAEALRAHFAAVPDFHVYDDGQRVSYDTMMARVRAGFSGLRSIEGGFNQIHVIVLSPDAALATAEFREAVTDRSSVTTRAHGAASWLWRRIEGRWRIVYGHVDHYRDRSAAAAVGEPAVGSQTLPPPAASETMRRRG
jgi:ketosteroid isomerase-like protein